jgi:ABC-2 type transport system ATP-binding protein
LLRPTGGTFKLLDMDPAADPVKVKRQVGVVPEDLALFDRLTGAETLSFVGQVHGMDRIEVRERSRELLTLMDLTKSANDLVADYSHGMRKKIALSAALLPAPRLLFLDEPFEASMRSPRGQIKDLLTAYVRGGGTVFLTTHILEIVERLCDSHRHHPQGPLVAQGSMAELRAGGATGQSLEERFMDIVGAAKSSALAIDWLADDRDASAVFAPSPGSAGACSEQHSPARAQRDSLEQVSRALALVIPLLIVAMSLGTFIAISASASFGGRMMATGMLEMASGLLVLRLLSA